MFAKTYIHTATSLANFLYWKIAPCHISIRDYQASFSSTSGIFGANSGKNRMTASPTKTTLFFGQFWLGNFATSGLAICFYLEAAQEKIC
ncbi:hypothetical protein [Undibacterium pigrum]|uniref:hypothetical protein n=1 Tax=Undibacterium pigrum TaxID=401470 RepID=UPI000D755524|nr:hypothetical protein [Undibacterium pigrum]